jgi:hypothetical protein
MGYAAAKAAREAGELTDGDPAWDRNCSCLVLGDNVGPAVRSVTLESAGVIFVEENGEGPGVRLRKGRK